METGAITTACASVLAVANVQRGAVPRRHADKQSIDLANLVAWSQAPQPAGFRVFVHRPRLDVHPPLIQCVCGATCHKERISGYTSCVEGP